MHRIVYPLVLLLASCSACDDASYSRADSVVADSDPIDERGPATSPAETPTDGPEGGDEPAQLCGGIHGLLCPGDMWCEFDGAPCGTRELTGLCVPRPEGCGANYDPVCGCDGLTHSNRCVAHSAGTAVALDGACETTPDTAPATTGCEPMDAVFAVCGDLCNAPPRWLWNGEACTAAVSCSCQGGDCASTYANEADCLDAHDHCEPELCRASAGQWRSSPPHDICGHYICGHAPPENCFAPVAGCDCGSGRSFVRGEGCAEDPDCGREDLCLATGGRLGACDRNCGEPADPCTGGGCECGPGARFDEQAGCVLSCRNDGGDLCTETGGQWAGNCGAFQCGQPSDDDCDGVACDCGRWANFAPTAGCVPDDDCLVRREGEYCRRSGAIDDCGAPLACCPAGTDHACAVPCCGTGCDPVSGCPSEG
jgi:hypothetical protein